MDPSAIAAYQELYQRVYLPTFLHKLASVYGIPARNIEDVQALAKIASYLQVAEHYQKLQEASSGNATTQFYKAAAASLDKAASGFTDQDRMQAYQKLASAIQAVVHDDQLRRAALTYAYALTE